MNTITKIKTIGLSKLNNAEYTHFMSNIETYTKVASVEKLGVSTELFDKFKSNILLLTDVAKQSRVHNETENLMLLGKNRADLLKYLLSYIKMERKNPSESRKKAATELFNVTKIYVGLEKLPTRQLGNNSQ